jgi:aryl-alcohol dehydrogenase-like predicted oxidoreductase
MRKLPGTDLVVSELCLGTMTFGEQTSKEQAFLQLDKATKDYGINFIVSFQQM